MRLLFSTLLIACASLQASEGWLDRVAPLLSGAERKAYLAMSPAAQERYEARFWDDKSVTAEEYFHRVAYIDSQYGSGKSGSGANTDQGRVYLALGAPNRTRRVPSSRIFVPLEIWYYSDTPGLLHTEMRLMFYQKNAGGFPKLYSPTLDTIRALLLPEAATRSMFGPNASNTESDIRKQLRTGPAEDEVITAAANIAAGIKYSGNDEILQQIASPRRMLQKPLVTSVRSRLVTARFPLETITSSSLYGGAQVDFSLTAAAKGSIRLQVLQGDATIYENNLQLNFASALPIVYNHRLDLLPGAYRVLFHVDEVPSVYALEVSAAQSMGEIRRVDVEGPAAGKVAPMEFNGDRLCLSPGGRMVFVPVPYPQRVDWVLRKGTETVWKGVSTADAAALIELPVRGIPPGNYRLEAKTQSESRVTEIAIGTAAETATEPATIVSYNANLAPASRLAFIGHQWLVRGNVNEARHALEASLTSGATTQTQVELARADALAGHLDEARERVRKVLSIEPDNFDALAVFAFVEACLQDYPVAADLYRRALTLRDSREMREALASLPAPH